MADENSGQDSQEIEISKTNLIVNYLPPVFSDDEFRSIFSAVGTVSHHSSPYIFFS